MRIHPAIRRSSWRALVLLAAAVVVPACSSNSNDAALPGSTYTPPAPVLVNLSANGPDQLHSVTVDPSGNFYVAGTSAATAAGAKEMVVLKYTAAGTLDPAFGGGDGIATIPAVVFAGGSDEIDIALQGTLIIVSATIANAGDAEDRDVVVFRLEADGDLDTTFATAPVGNGIRLLDLNTADVIVPVPPSTATRRGVDSARSVAVASDGSIFLHANQKAVGNIPGTVSPRIDTDFALVKLTAAGNVDTTFADSGKHLLDINLANATPRGIRVFEGALPTDLRVLCSGYTTAFTSGAQPVLYKLDSTGKRDTTFSTGGVYHQFPLALQTEIYNFAVHGTNLVTAGYGRDTGTRNDWCSLRFAVGNGARDLTWGGTSNGVTLVNPSPDPAVGSNCRNAVGLPGGKTMLIGSTGTGVPTQDAVIAVLDASGYLDPAYGSVAHLLPFGSNGADQFWGGAANTTHALVVGWKGVTGTVTAANNDDSYALFIPLQ